MATLPTKKQKRRFSDECLLADLGGMNAMVVNHQSRGMFYLDGKPLCEAKEVDLTTCIMSEGGESVKRMPDIGEELSFTASIQDSRETREFFKKQEFERRKAVKKLRQRVNKAMRMAKSQQADQPVRKTHPWPEKKTHNSWLNRSK